MDKDCIVCAEINSRAILRNAEVVEIDGAGAICFGCFHDGVADDVTHITPDYDGEKTWRL